MLRSALRRIRIFRKFIGMAQNFEDNDSHSPENFQIVFMTSTDFSEGGFNEPTLNFGCPLHLQGNIGLSWFKALSDEFKKDYFAELSHFLKNEREKFIIYPPEDDVYYWTNVVRIQDVKVIILGQDPYHGLNQAHGLAFSVRKGLLCPPSLKNIYKELAADISGFEIPTHGFLFGWASQGVLLLNTTLTVRAGCANSHSSSNWSCLTDAVIKWIDQNLPNSVFMLWGRNAQQKMSLITKGNHLILTASHPSPFSANRGFFGCRHFSKANEYLEKHGKEVIDWNYLP